MKRMLQRVDILANVRIWKQINVHLTNYWTNSKPNEGNQNKEGNDQCFNVECHVELYKFLILSVHPSMRWRMG